MATLHIKSTRRLLQGKEEPYMPGTAKYNRKSSNKPEEFKDYQSPEKRLLKRTNHSSTSSLRRGSRSSLGKATRQRFYVESARQELLTLWEFSAIPTQHRSLFSEKAASLTPLKAVAFFKAEIRGIRSNKGVIARLCAGISRREELLDKLKGQVSEFRSEESELLEIGRLIEEIRHVTIETVEFIAAWRQLVSRKVDFEWNGVCYLAKLRQDTEFLHYSQLQSWFDFKKSDDPFIVNPTQKLSIKNKRINRNVIRPIEVLALARINSLIKHLSLTPIPSSTTFSQKVLRKPLRKSLSNRNKLSIELRQSPLSGSSVNLLPSAPLPPLFIKEFAENYIEAAIQFHIDSHIEDLIATSKAEMIFATLILHSSTILDKYITEVLATKIPEIATEITDDLKNIEYIDFTELVLDEFSSKIARECLPEALQWILSYTLVDEITGLYEVAHVVSEALEEEVLQSETAGADVLQSIIEDLLNEDWLEAFAEEQIINQQLRQLRLTLPVKVQREILLAEKQENLDLVAEEIYFQLVIDFVGGFWLDRLLLCCSREQGNKVGLTFEEIFITRDPGIDIDEFKKEAMRRRLSIRHR